MTIRQDILTLAHAARVEMWVLDLTALGGSVYRFCNHVNERQLAVVWQGLTYEPFPISASGFEKTGRGPFPRPRVKIADVTGAVGALKRQYQGLAGGRVTRKQTLAKYLDAVNFSAGNPNANVGAYFADEIYVIDRCSADNGVFLEFELAASVDVAGVRLPLRQVIQNLCVWSYRGSECGYAGGPVADENDVATSNPSLDKCGKRLVSCKFRFPNDLPTSAFPTAGLTRI